MPYTWGLLSSVADVTADTSARLIPIPGQPAQPAQPAQRLRLPPPVRAPGQGARRPVRDDACPPLSPGKRGDAHLKRCHLPDPDAIYQTEVLPEIAPDLVEEDLRS